METIRLYELPVLSQEIEDGVHFCKDGLLVVLTFQGLVNDKLTHFEIKFSKVLCCMHTNEQSTIEFYRCLDTIVEVINSQWINHLKATSPIDFDFWKPKHYAIYFDSVGQFQFIASDYTVTMREVF